MSTTRVVVTASAGRDAAVTVVTPGPTGRGHLGVRRLPTRAGVARLALVAEGALLLAGDDVGVELVVGAGARVEVVEPSGTVAYPMRGGRADWRVDLTVGDGATLRWRGLPFVVAEGADVDRSTSVRLAEGAVAVLREVLVLGRSGEPGGAIGGRLRVDGVAGPVLAEDLLLGPQRPSVGVVGGARVVDTLTVLGARAGAAPEGVTRLELEAEGTQLRWLGAATHESPLEGWAAPLAAQAAPA
ncbi:urease accessory protein UreD [Lapillicoccus jejuensis]|uniref:Urease accessory protein UreD n=1 Tax=Lapillicoccus jejuensis TaxID=402171 RepID=A0A542E4Y4_9MICO|nr:urease accessory protein UreD [Lapillicoccus jejuensis]TQJ10401.1 urease accessory protein [Lapillicoccus jejuensis]